MKAREDEIKNDVFLFVFILLFVIKMLMISAKMNDKSIMVFSPILSPLQTN